MTLLGSVFQADPAVVLSDSSSVVVCSNRMQDGSVPPLEQGMVVGQLVLADALIVGNWNNQVLRRSEFWVSRTRPGLTSLLFLQVKFSELTIDMFRMLQALEREPVNLATQSSKQGPLVSFTASHLNTCFIADTPLKV